MKEFFPKDKDEKTRKKVVVAVKSLEKKQYIFPQINRDWQMQETSIWFVASTGEANDYYVSLLEKYG